jgi:hypothetical protein
MKSIRITFFVTGVILFAMVLGSLKAQAQVPYDQCAADSKKLYMDIQIYNQTEKISSQHAVIGKRLQQDLNNLKIKDATVLEKVHLLEASFARCYIDLTADEEIAIQMNVEMFKKGTHPSASDE